MPLRKVFDCSRESEGKGAEFSFIGGEHAANLAGVPASMKRAVGAANYRRHKPPIGLDVVRSARTMKLPFKGQSVLPVRPYIRLRVFTLLRSLGLEVDESDVMPAGMRDAEVLRLLQQHRPSVLLIPFHAHRDASGAPLNGLDILPRLRELPHLAATPIVMPISEIGEASFDLLVSREHPGSELSAVLERTFLLRTRELDAPNLTERLERHLSTYLKVPKTSGLG